MYRGRFAPSPTGELHLGHAWMALQAWQRCREAGGRFVIRIEDLDTPRVRPGAEAAMLADLRWLGVDWDEGPDVGGPYGPYRQSERLAHYEAALARFLEAELAYPCSCSRKDLRLAASAPHGLESLGAPYPGTCRQGPQRAEGPHATRLRMPVPAPAFRDEVLGAPEEPPNLWDCVLKRRDGLFAYQLAVAVDDAAMAISEVVRGEDLYLATYWQIAVIEALGGLAPRYAHLPLMRNAAGQRLAKRDASLTLRSLRDRGVDPAKLQAQLLALAAKNTNPDATTVLDAIAEYIPTKT